MTDLKGAHILIVDDQPSNVLFLQRLLEHEGYTHVSSTTRSSDVVELFENTPPDLLLLDLQMPAPDGFAVMERSSAGRSVAPTFRFSYSRPTLARRRASGPWRRAR